MNRPRISIVTPSYNQAQFLERTLRSVLDQRYPDLEYVVMDGGSTDGSADLIRKYADQLTYWVSEKDRGQSDAINRGFARCTGDVFGWVNSDDYLMPGALEAVAQAWRADPDAGAWVGDCLRTSEGTDEEYTIEASALDLDTLGNRWFEVFFGQPSCFFSARAWRECGPLDEDLHYSMDLDLWLKMLKKFRFVHVPCVLSCAPKHPDAKTVAQRRLSIAQTWVVRARHGFAAAVESEIAALLAEHERNVDKIRRLTRSTVYRALRPVLKAMGLVGRGED